MSEELNARSASTSGHVSERLVRSSRRDERAGREAHDPLEAGEHEVGVLRVEHDRGDVLRAHDVGPARDELVVPVAVPEARVERAVAVVVEHRVQPLVVRPAHAALDRLLPVRGHDAHERAQRDDDVHVRPAYLVEERADLVAGGVGEELAAQHHPGQGRADDLAAQGVPPLGGGLVGVAEHPGAAERRDRGGGGVARAAGVVDALASRRPRGRPRTRPAPRWSPSWADRCAPRSCPREPAGSRR